jgi:hypothetical protein
LSTTQAADWPKAPAWQYTDTGSAFGLLSLVSTRRFAGPALLGLYYESDAFAPLADVGRGHAVVGQTSGRAFLKPHLSKLHGLSEDSHCHW